MKKLLAVLLTSMMLALVACKSPPPNPTGDSPEVASHKVKGVSGASGSSPLQVSLGGTGITSSGDAGLVLTSNGTGFYMAPGGGGSGGGAGSALNTIGQRLTLTSGVAVTTGNVVGATSLFFTPFQSDTIALDVSGVWTGFETAEISISTTALTAANTYDVFVFPFAGTTPTLAFSAAWSGAATRTDAITQVNGVWVKSADNSLRYVGTIFTTSTTGTTTAEDSASHRYVYNFYNQQPRELLVTDSTQFWSYTTAAWRPGDNNAANSVSLVLGMPYEQVELTVQTCQSAVNGGNMSLGVGIDSTTVNSATLYGSGGQAIGGLPTLAFYAGGPGLGKHTLTWLEWGATGGQFYGNVNNLGSQIAGMRGSAGM